MLLNFYKHNLNNTSLDIEGKNKVNKIGNTITEYDTTYKLNEKLYDEYNEKLSLKTLTFIMDWVVFMLLEKLVSMKLKKDIR